MGPWPGPLDTPFPETPIHISGLVGRAYLSRGAWLWLGMRAGLGALLVSLSDSPLRVSAADSAVVVAGVLVLSYADVRMRSERTFLHNLGLPPMLIVALSALPAVVAEAAIRFAESVSR